jgi:hypothetical protein
VPLPDGPPGRCAASACNAAASGTACSAGGRLEAASLFLGQCPAAGASTPCPPCFSVGCTIVLAGGLGCWCWCCCWPFSSIRALACLLTPTGLALLFLTGGTGGCWGDEAGCRKAPCCVPVATASCLCSLLASEGACNSNGNNQLDMRCCTVEYQLELILEHQRSTHAAVIGRHWRREQHHAY